MPDPPHFRKIIQICLQPNNRTKKWRFIDALAFREWLVNFLNTNLLFHSLFYELSSLCVVTRFQILSQLNVVIIKMHIFCLEIPKTRCPWTLSNTLTNCFGVFCCATCWKKSRVYKITNWSSLHELCNESLHSWWSLIANRAIFWRKISNWSCHIFIILKILPNNQNALFFCIAFHF